MTKPYTNQHGSSNKCADKGGSKSGMQTYDVTFVEHYGGRRHTAKVKASSASGAVTKYSRAHKSHVVVNATKS